MTHQLFHPTSLHEYFTQENWRLHSARSHGGSIPWLLDNVQQQQRWYISPTSLQCVNQIAEYSSKIPPSTWGVVVCSKAKRKSGYIRALLLSVAKRCYRQKSSSIPLFLHYHQKKIDTLMTRESADLPRCRISIWDQHRNPSHILQSKSKSKSKANLTGQKIAFLAFLGLRLLDDNKLETTDRLIAHAQQRISIHEKCKPRKRVNWISTELFQKENII